MSKQGKMSQICWPKCCTVPTNSCLSWICQQRGWSNTSHAVRKAEFSLSLPLVAQICVKSLPLLHSSNMLLAHLLFHSNLTISRTVNKHLSHHQKSPAIHLPPSSLSKKSQTCQIETDQSLSDWLHFSVCPDSGRAQARLKSLYQSNKLKWTYNQSSLRRRFS